jgi:WD40 repeat protein
MDKTVRLWSVATGAKLKILIGHAGPVNSVAFHPNGHQIASASLDNTVRIWTVCEWSDRLHHLFGAELRRVVFVLMCVKARQEAERAQPRLPMQIWLHVLQSLISTLRMTPCSAFPTANMLKIAIAAKAAPTPG